MALQHCVRPLCASLAAHCRRFSSHRWSLFTADATCLAPPDARYSLASPSRPPLFRRLRWRRPERDAAAVRCSGARAGRVRCCGLQHRSAQGHGLQGPRLVFSLLSLLYLSLSLFSFLPLARSAFLLRYALLCIVCMRARAKKAYRDRNHGGKGKTLRVRPPLLSPAAPATASEPLLLQCFTKGGGRGGISRKQRPKKKKKKKKKERKKKTKGVWEKSSPPPLPSPSLRSPSLSSLLCTLLPRPLPQPPTQDSAAASLPLRLALLIAEQTEKRKREQIWRGLRKEQPSLATPAASPLTSHPPLRPSPKAFPPRHGTTTSTSWSTSSRRGWRRSSSPAGTRATTCRATSSPSSPRPRTT